MIGLTFQGQLGNQMFQYAAARIQAERLGCGVVIDYNCDFRSALHNAVRAQTPYQLFNVFPGLRVHPLSHGLAVIKEKSKKKYHPHARALLFPNRFEPRHEAYDDRIWLIDRGTWLKGYFQSARYLSGWEQQVRDWFRPTRTTASAVMHLTAKLPAKPCDMVAVHVRLGDYLVQNDQSSGPATGWALTTDYYARGLSQFPETAPIALFSDDPEAAAALLPRTPAWISSGQEVASDLFLMSSFPRLVMANSSFSWWAAWLGTQQEKQVVAPEFHIGWRRRQWVPPDIKVERWTYV